MRASRTLLAASVLLGGCGVAASYREASEAALRRGDFRNAYQNIQLAREEAPDDPEIQRMYWELRKALLLDNARQYVFRDEDERALEELAKVLAVDPTNPIALRWREKAVLKLADRSTAFGVEAFRGGDLETALRSYHEALTYLPGHAPAEAGLRELAEDWQKRRAKAQDHYLDGVRALARQLFHQTRYQMLVALESDPTLDRAEDAKVKAARRLAEERFSKAKDMERRGYYEVALREYRAVADVLHDAPDLADRIARSEREVDAKKLGDEGVVALHRGDYETARRCLDEAFEKSVEQRPHYSDLLLRVRERELEHRYTLARDIEMQGTYEDAVVAYAAIVESAPDGFLDVLTRLGDLRTAIEMATKAYDAGAAAEAAGDFDQALEQFRDAAVYYPKFRDVGERLERLRARQTEGGPPQNGPR
jgi:tetratricopeptide (TPR) repeat protein